MSSSLFGGFGVGIPSLAARARIRVMDIGDGHQRAALRRGRPRRDGVRVGALHQRGRQPGNDPAQRVRRPGSNSWTGAGDITKDGNHLDANVELGSCSDSSERITYQNVGYVDRYNSGSPGMIVREGHTHRLDVQRQLHLARERLCDVSITAGGDASRTLLTLPDFSRRCTLLLAGGGTSHPSHRRTDTIGSETSRRSTPATVAAGDGTDARRVSAGRCGGGRVCGPPEQQQAIMAGDDRQEGPIQNLTLGDDRAHQRAAAPRSARRCQLTLRPLQSDERPATSRWRSAARRRRAGTS